MASPQMRSKRRKNALVTPGFAKHPGGEIQGDHEGTSIAALQLAPVMWPVPAPRSRTTPGSEVEWLQSAEQLVSDAPPVTLRRPRNLALARSNQARMPGAGRGGRVLSRWRSWGWIVGGHDDGALEAAVVSPEGPAISALRGVARVVVSPCRNLVTNVANWRSATETAPAAARADFNVARVGQRCPRVRVRRRARSRDRIGLRSRESAR